METNASVSLSLSSTNAENRSSPHHHPSSSPLRGRRFFKPPTKSGNMNGIILKFESDAKPVKVKDLSDTLLSNGKDFNEDKEPPVHASSSNSHIRKSKRVRNYYDDSSTNNEAYDDEDSNPDPSGTESDSNYASSNNRRRRLNNVGIGTLTMKKSKKVSNQNNISDESFNDGEEPLFLCQACSKSTKKASCIIVNHHHHNNPFYSPMAIYAKVGIGSPYIANGPSNSAWNSVSTYETVSTKPTTAAIPVETVTLCEICAGLFSLHRLQCDTCNYVPRLDEKLMRDCTKCFEGVITRC